MKNKLISLAAVAALVLSVFANPVTFVWERSADDQGTNNISYAVYQAVGTNAFVKIANTGTNATYSTNLVPGVYRFYVVAQDFWGVESDPSNTVGLPGSKKPAAPQQPILYVIVGDKTNTVINLGQ